jgi:hypothetical protein
MALELGALARDSGSRWPFEWVILCSVHGRPRVRPGLRPTDEARDGLTDRRADAATYWRRTAARRARDGPDHAAAAADGPEDQSGSAACEAGEGAPHGSGAGRAAGGRPGRGEEARIAAADSSRPANPQRELLPANGACCLATFAEPQQLRRLRAVAGRVRVP